MCFYIYLEVDAVLVLVTLHQVLCCGVTAPPSSSFLEKKKKKKLQHPFLAAVGTWNNTKALNLPVIHSGALPNCIKTKVIDFHKFRTKEMFFLIQIAFVFKPICFPLQQKEQHQGYTFQYDLLLKTQSQLHSFIYYNILMAYCNTDVFKSQYSSC